MTNLKTIIANASKPGGVFMPVDSAGNATGMNEIVWFYPFGNAERKVKVNCHVFEDALPGSNETHGDGVILNSKNREAQRDSIKIECSVDIGIQDSQRPREPDVFVVDNIPYAVVRVVGRDDTLMTVLCTRNTHKRTTNLSG